MFQRVLQLMVLWLGLAGAASSAELTQQETEWLSAAMPVLQYAKKAMLPVDVVVQPQEAAGLAPVALAWVDGRCKFVLSMRGNDEVEASRSRMPVGLFTAAVQAMAAHEMGHCWRHVQKTWNTLPTDLQEVSDEAGLAPDLAKALSDMRRTRREEGFGDLVGLAWTRQFNAQAYAAVQAWLAREREQETEGAHHDTRAWVRLAQNPQVFTSESDLFHQVETAWRTGLLDGS